ncbi:hypothetical protein FTI75_20460 [Burkholderia pseudomallei]|nr:hypothetical protein D2V84_25550 [Burkholderia pseudomallei]RIV75036.1 hypothetical protein D2W72_06485 [Burkholderia pseudomallei]TXD02824.1 hypothetical protein FTI75_20460 [Burkholderia pseudomallei]
MERRRLISMHGEPIDIAFRKPQAASRKPQAASRKPQAASLSRETSTPGTSSPHPPPRHRVRFEAFPLSENTSHSESELARRRGLPRSRVASSRNLLARRIAPILNRKLRLERKRVWLKNNKRKSSTRAGAGFSRVRRRGRWGC